MPRLSDNSYGGRGVHGDLVNDLATQIVDGSLSPGTQLDLQAVAARARVSRTVVREALKTLQAKGLVEARPRWGTRVREPSSWNMLDPDVIGWLGEAKVAADFLEDLAFVREAIEPAAAWLAAKKASKADVATLRAAFEAFARSVAEDVDEIVDCDVAFHVSILEVSRNRFFRQMAPLLSAALRGRDRLVLAEPRRRRHKDLMVDEHERVIDAIASKDAEAAETSMRMLMRQSRTDARAVVAAKRRRTRVT